MFLTDRNTGPRVTVELHRSEWAGIANILFEIVDNPSIPEDWKDRFLAARTAMIDATDAADNG